MRSATGLNTVIDVTNRLHYKNPLGKLPNRWINEVADDDTVSWIMKVLDPKTNYEKPRKANDKHFKAWAHNSTIYDRESAVDDYLNSLPPSQKVIPRLKYDIMKYDPHRMKKVKDGEDRYYRFVPESDLEYKNRMNAEAIQSFWDIKDENMSRGWSRAFNNPDKKLDESKNPFDFEGGKKDKKDKNEKKKPSGRSPFGFRYAQNRTPIV